MRRVVGLKDGRLLSFQRRFSLNLARKSGFCIACGSIAERKIPKDEIIDDISLIKFPLRKRLVCSDSSCRFVLYENPKPVVGSVPLTLDGKGVLLCKRSIQPREGFWTIPSGFMEMGESVREGAQREAFEEAGVSIKIGALLGIYDVPHVGQMMIIFRSLIQDVENVIAGSETAESLIFPLDRLPKDEDLAFDTVRLSLLYCKKTLDQKDGTFPPEIMTLPPQWGTS